MDLDPEETKKWAPVFTAFAAALAPIVIAFRKMIGPWLERRRAAVAVEKRSAWDQMIARLAERDEQLKELRAEKEELECQLSAANERIITLYQERAEKAERVKEASIAQMAAIVSQRPTSRPPSSGVTSAKTPPSSTSPKSPQPPTLPSSETLSSRKS